jgi:hypothetical protein
MCSRTHLGPSVLQVVPLRQYLSKGCVPNLDCVLDSYGSRVQDVRNIRKCLCGITTDYRGRPATHRLLNYEGKPLAEAR